MNPHRIEHFGDAALSAPPYERIDMLRRDVVDHGISLQESSNTVAAVEYLKSRDVPARVIERVLLDRQQRRFSH